MTIDRGRIDLYYNIIDMRNNIQKEERKKYLKNRLKELAYEMSIITLKRHAYSIGNETNFIGRMAHKKLEIEFRKLSLEYRKLSVGF